MEGIAEMAPDTGTMETLIKSVERLEQDRETAWKNVRILESARQEQDKKLAALQSSYTQLSQEKLDLEGQLASAEALIETLQEKLK